MNKYVVKIIIILILISVINNGNGMLIENQDIQYHQKNNKLSYSLNNNTFSIFVNLSKPINDLIFDINKVCNTEISNPKLNTSFSLSQLITIALPPDKEIDKIYCDSHSSIVLPLNNLLEKKTLKLNNNNSSKTLDDHSLVKLRSKSYFHCYHIIDFVINPMRIDIESNQFIFYTKIIIHITLKDDSHMDIIPQYTSQKINEKAHLFILNYNQSNQWYPIKKNSSAGTFDYVIIADSSLASSLESLVEWEKIKGKNVKFVNLSWITENYLGKDLPEKIRNFLRTSYDVQQWGIRDVLIVGHPDDIPLRRAGYDKGEGAPLTDYYYAELSLPDEKSWDANKNGIYGERSDSIDYYAEVNVGRIPFSDPQLVSSICERMIQFEQNNDPSYKRNMLLLGAYFWNNTDNARLMEYICMNNALNEWEFTRLYEQNNDYFSSYECDKSLTNQHVMQSLNENCYALVNWAAHGTPTSAHALGLNMSSFISTKDLDNLNVSYSPVVIATACRNADFDYFTSLASEMMKEFAVGFLGPTKSSFAAKNWQNELSGSSQSMSYFITTLLASGNYSFGEAHQLALNTMHQYSLWFDPYYELFEWGTLLGNPDLQMNGIGNYPNLTIDEITGGKGITIDVVNTGNANAINVSIQLQISGGLFLGSSENFILIPSISKGEIITISFPVLGFGLGFFSPIPFIKVTVTEPSIGSVSYKSEAKIIGPYVFLNDSYASMTPL